MESPVKVVITQPGRREGAGALDFERMRILLSPSRGRIDVGSVVVLPELIGNELDSESYVRQVRALAIGLRSWVVGGSHFDTSGPQSLNCGVVMDPRGNIAARYAKANPYGDEREYSIASGDGPACFIADGVRCVAMICADFWHPSSFPDEPVDLILVPAFSATQRPGPAMARARWRHAMIARAYEHSAYVAVSDWAYPTSFRNLKSSGAAAFAQPNPNGPHQLCRSLGQRRKQAFALDLDSLCDLRENKAHRGFNPF
jgi:predicted amidohydrolase